LFDSAYEIAVVAMIYRLSGHRPARVQYQTGSDKKTDAVAA